MSERIVIANKNLHVEISTFGAELKSIEKNGEELLWSGDPDVWPGQAPILFPICGGLKEDKYEYNGKEYTLLKHGYARSKEFEVETRETDKVVFLLKSDDETLKAFPFEYELRVIYTLRGDSLNVEYSVKNIDNGKMYFSIGAHEGYVCPEGIEEYTVVFDKKENLRSTVLNGNLLSDKTISVGENTDELDLKYEYFAVDALVFLDLKSKKVTLRNNRTGKCIGVEFDGADYLLLWTKPNGKYICIEPWCGLPDFEGSSYDITEKRGIIPLESGSTYTFVHNINF